MSETPNPEVVRARNIIEYLTEQLHEARERLAALEHEIPPPGTECFRARYDRRSHDADVRMCSNPVYVDDDLVPLCSSCRADVEHAKERSRRRQQALETARPQVATRTYSRFTSPTGWIHVFVDEPDPQLSRLLCRRTEIGDISKWSSGSVITGDDAEGVSCVACLRNWERREAHLEAW